MVNKAQKIIFLLSLVVLASADYLNEYNGIIFGSMSGYSGETEGRLAVGGAATLTTYGVGTELTKDCSRIDLQIGGSFVGTDGNSDNGITTVGGDTVTTAWSIGCNSIAKLPLDIDMIDARSVLSAYSTEIGSQSTTGSISTVTDDLYLSGTATINYFNIESSSLASISTIHIDIPSNSWAFINIHGSSDFDHIDISLSATSDIQRILYNFPEAITIRVEFVSFKGTVLAPYAGFTLNNGEVIRTTVIATFAVNFSYLRNSPFIYPPVDPPTCEDPPTPIDPPTPPTPEDPPTPIDPPTVKMILNYFLAIEPSFKFKISSSYWCNQKLKNSKMAKSKFTAVNLKVSS